MAKKTYLCLYILCAILIQEIVGTSLEEDIEVEPTNTLVRKKRVINRIPGEDVPLPLRSAPWVVNVKKNDRVHCVGSILSHHTVITVERCVSGDIRIYKVLAGSIHSHRGSTHNVTNKKVHGINDIALITINPAFVYDPNIGNINLHSGIILPGMSGTIYGWASYYYGGPSQSIHQRKLRKIIVPIINHQECVNSYRDYFRIEESHLCTYHKDKQCGYTDTGASLVIDNLLAGVYLGLIETNGNSHCRPDVFIMPQHSQYHQWVMRNIVN